MYEQNEVPVFRRILWIVLWAVVVIAVIWVLVWLVFFRHPNKASIPIKNPAMQTQQTNKSAQPPTPNDSQKSTSSSTGSTAPGNTSSAPSSSAPAASSSQLANTGAGNVVVPVVAAALAGSTFYYIRLRRKLV